MERGMEAWVDVGGTFTDCFVKMIDGEIRRLKLLSSGLVPISGRWVAPTEPTSNGWVAPIEVDRWVAPIEVDRWVAPTEIACNEVADDPDDFWNGASLRLLDADGRLVASRIVVNCKRGVLRLDEPLDRETAERIGEVPKKWNQRRATEGVQEPLALRMELDAGLESPVLGVRRLIGCGLQQPLPPLRVRLGTTRGTNALLTRQGAKTAFAITSPFEDLQAIGDQTRPQLFDLSIRKPKPLPEQVLGIEERLDAKGRVTKTLDLAQATSQLQKALDAGCASLAICLMHSYLNPVHECQLEELALQMGFQYVSRSSAIAPLIELVARSQTTVVDAYLSPIIRRYLSTLAMQFGGSLLQLDVMTSSGGLAEWQGFAGKDSILSGPAGGAVALQGLSRSLGGQQLIGLDMGGTSTDVCRVGTGHTLEYESIKAGVRILTPTMPIETVAAGGGSICWFDGVSLRVGPQSAGALPGPACYGRGGPLTITDLNVFLGRLPASQFPFSLDLRAVERRIDEVLDQLREALPIREREELAKGFRRLANEQMSAAVRTVTTAKGIDPRTAALVGFGGAAGQHICEIADLLGMSEIIDHPDAGLFSALGMGLASLRLDAAIPVYQSLTNFNWSDCSAQINLELLRLNDALVNLGISKSQLESEVVAEVRYVGTDTALTVSLSDGPTIAESFHQLHMRRFGYERRNYEIELVAIRVECCGRSLHQLPDEASVMVRNAEEWPSSSMPNSSIALITRECVNPGGRVIGPAIVLNQGSTLVIDPGWMAECLNGGSLRIRRTVKEIAKPSADSLKQMDEFDPVTRDCLGQRFSAIATQMGVVLQQTAISVNVKQRRDYSCAIFNASGHLLANAPHVPVHLGAMGQTVREVMRTFPSMCPGDSFITNDPYRGGSHLPDITVVTPVFADTHETANEQFDRHLVMFVANRAHHADVGGIAPGSMSVTATRLVEEGVIIPPMYLTKGGVDQTDTLRSMLEQSPYPPRAIDVNLADLAAQQASNMRGVALLQEFSQSLGWQFISKYSEHLMQAASQRVAQFLRSLPQSPKQFTDSLDDGTQIAVDIHFPTPGKICFDFGRSGGVSPTNFNANPSIVSAAVMYVLRCMIADELPMNEGIMRCVELRIPHGILNPMPSEWVESPTRRANVGSDLPAVAAGNVETSQRVVDVLLGAFGTAAASQGTMNNLLFGNRSFGFYETICGGAGATEGCHGASGVHTHMTNTRLTDPEILESKFPVRLVRFQLRPGSGGQGKWQGGDGIIRELEFLEPVQLSLLTSRRSEKFPPYGLRGGRPGAIGRNVLVRKSGSQHVLDSCSQLEVEAGDRIVIETPGGGAVGV
jgi:5-oxoprolinase (ATP-hydrolysing)